MHTILFLLAKQSLNTPISKPKPATPQALLHDKPITVFCSALCLVKNYHKKYTISSLEIISSVSQITQPQPKTHFSYISSFLDSTFTICAWCDRKVFPKRLCKMTGAIKTTLHTNLCNWQSCFS